jgi:hypothetical protein
MKVAIIILGCALAICATFRMQAIAVANYNPTTWETVVLLSAWDSLVYPAIVGLACLFRRSPRSLWVVLTGTVALTSLSVWILYFDLQPYFTPPVGNARVHNSYGPIIQLALPFLQWTLFAVLTAGAWWCSSTAPADRARQP